MSYNRDLYSTLKCRTTRILTKSISRRYVSSAPKKIEIASFAARIPAGLERRLSVQVERAFEKARAYQMRVAVRDAGSGRIGSASQFIKVPDVQRRHIALSGIIMNSLHASDSYDENASNKDYEVAQPGTAAMRIFHAGENVSFGYVIFDARPDSKTGRAKIETQFSLYRDGRPVYTSPATPLKTEQQVDLGPLNRANRRCAQRACSGLLASDGDVSINLSDSFAEKCLFSAARPVFIGRLKRL
jgi:hypothetical protein